MPRGSGIPTDEAVPMLADALAYYDVADVQRWFERNERMTGRTPTVWPSTIEDARTFKKVPNEPFRKAWLQLQQPMILGLPVAVTGSPQGTPHTGETQHEPEWCGLFREELQRVIALPEALDFRPNQIGPSDLSCGRIGDYLHSALGITATQGKGGISLAWLIDYNVAEALCKALGLIPYTVGI